MNKIEDIKILTNMKRSDIPTKAVLLACHRFYNGDELAPWEILVSEFNAPEKVVYAAMEREYNKGFIEYGTTLRTSWVTSEGYEFLKNEKYSKSVSHIDKK